MFNKTQNKKLWPVELSNELRSRWQQVKAANNLKSGQVISLVFTYVTFFKVIYPLSSIKALASLYWAYSSNGCSHAALQRRVVVP